MRGITLDDLQPLLDQFAGEGTVLSCYADLGVRDGFRHAWEAPFKAKADALWKAVGEAGRARGELEENLAAVRRGVEAAAAAGARWAAVFSAARRDFFHAVPLDTPVGTDLVLDRSPYLVPLQEAIARRREYLVVHADTHRGRLTAASPGAARVLGETSAEVPSKQHSAGERWGYSQATIARHRDDRMLHFRKELVREVEKAWDANRFAGLVLLGEHVAVEHLRAALPPRLAARVVSAFPEPWHADPAGAEARARTIAADLSAGWDDGVPPECWDLLREGKAATGARAVAEALQGGRLGADGHGYLVFGPDPREAAGRCVACRTVTTDPLGPCPRCQAPCVPGNLWEELLLTALRHGVAMYLVGDGRKLDPYGGVAAILPRPGDVNPSPAAGKRRVPSGA